MGHNRTLSKSAGTSGSDHSRLAGPRTKRPFREGRNVASIHLAHGAVLSRTSRRQSGQEIPCRGAQGHIRPRRI
jgi:hypothetical protein